MSKNNIVTKRLFHIQIEDGGGEINIFCVCNIKTGYIGIRTDRKKYFKHKKIPIKQKRKYLSTCGFLKQHVHDLKDDPERLSTEFIQKMIGVKCI